MRLRVPIALIVPRGLAAIALTVCAATGSANPIELRWNACWGDGGVMNRDFSCDTNTRGHVLIGSFISPQEFPFVVGMEATLDLGIAGGSVPPWWQFRDAGSCRQTSLLLTTAPPVTAVNCEDWAQGQAIGLIASYTLDPYLLGSARLRLATAVPNEHAADILSGREYFSFQLRIDSQKTVGAGACEGCMLGACIALKSIRLNSLSPGNLLLTTGLGSAGSDERLVTWQGGAGVVFQLRPDALNCPLATPTRTSTWGAVKSLYR